MMAGRNIFACWLRHRKSSTLIRKYRRVNLKLPLLPCLDLGFILWLQLNFCLGAICQFGRCFVSPAASRFDCHMRATAFRETFCLKLLPQTAVLNTRVTWKVVTFQTGKPLNFHSAMVPSTWIAHGPKDQWHMFVSVCVRHSLTSWSWYRRTHFQLYISSYDWMSQLDPDNEKWL